MIKGEKRHLIHQKYRKDIDGLRALAILPVIFFHAFPQIVPGGFIGVDIFFVISGYLITTIIISSLEHDRFTLVGFYIRRIRRIIPALVLVLLITALVGWYILFSSEFENIGKHILSSAGFVQNFTLWNEIDYFDRPAEVKPLLHLWSLSVEEQFYILWPVLLVYAWKHRWNAVYVISLIALISFMSNIFLTYRNTSAAFYFPVTRFWELMIGSLLAYLVLHQSRMINNYANIRSFIGLALIIFTIFSLNEEKLFPGWWALLPVLGAASIISSGKDSWINRHILSNKLLVGIGLISYPLYLWHWPIFSFLRITEPDPSSLELSVAILLSAALATLTMYAIENPFRYKGNPHNKAVILLLLLAATGVLGGGIWLTDGNLSRLSNVQERLSGGNTLALFKSTRRSDGSCKELNGIEKVDEEICLSTSSDPEILFVGDSHAMALFSAIKTGDIDLKAILIAAHSCAPFPNLYYEPDPRKSWSNNCTQVARHALHVANSIKSIRTVVLVNNKGISTAPAKYYLRKNSKKLGGLEAFVNGYGGLIKGFFSLEKNVVLVSDTPWLLKRPDQCLNRLPFVSVNSCDVSLDTVNNNHMRIRFEQGVGVLSHYFPDMKIYRPINYLCHNNVCASKIDGNWIYYDTNHLNTYGSRLLLSDMLQSGYLD